MKPNIKAEDLSARCLACGVKGSQYHFIYGLPPSGVGTAVPYCPGEDRRDSIRQVTEKHGSALYWSWLGWKATGPLGEKEKSRWGGEATHVYHFYDRQGNLLYVGITNDLKRRWAQHAEEKPWWHLVARKESVKYPTREEAERVEAHQIRTLRPQFNRALNGWFS
jgi:hypothetical protein